MKFLSEDQTQKDYAALLGMFPARLEPQQQVGDSGENHKAFFEAIQSGRTYAPIPQWGQIENAYKTRFGNILDSAAGVGKDYSEATVKSQLDAAAKEADGLLGPVGGVVAQTTLQPPPEAGSARVLPSRRGAASPPPAPQAGSPTGLIAPAVDVHGARAPAADRGRRSSSRFKRLNTFTFSGCSTRPGPGSRTTAAILFDAANPLHDGFFGAVQNTAVYTFWTVGADARRRPADRAAAEPRRCAGSGSCAR